MKEMKAKFEGLKKLTRKKAASEKQSLRATGGGPRTTTNNDGVGSQTLDRVHGMITLSADGLEARDDSDLMSATEQKGYVPLLKLLKLFLVPRAKAAGCGCPGVWVEQ